jgi:hypothetical protein
VNGDGDGARRVQFVERAEDALAVLLVAAAGDKDPHGSTAGEPGYPMIAADLAR